jgi:hypothetical protein
MKKTCLHNFEDVPVFIEEDVEIEASPQKKGRKGNGNKKGTKRGK